MDDAKASVAPTCSAADLFGVMWETIADVLGTAATATLIKRSAKRASERRPDLDALIIQREGFDYSYVVPDLWRRNDTDMLSSLRELAFELSPLLSELTGPVIIRRLRSIPELDRCEIRFAERST